jgi:hypothetical protein
VPPHDIKLRKAFISAALFHELRPVTRIPRAGGACRFVASVAFLLVAVLVPGVAAAQKSPQSPVAPFGWSSAIADFNADGRPDLAVARRLGNHGGSDFRIDFQLSNGRRQSVLFASTLPALRVTAVDIDNDHDVDLVVTPLLGHHVIGVWLNDGAGNFRRGRSRDLGPAAARLSTSTLNGLPPQFALATPSPRRMALLSSPARAPTSSFGVRSLAVASTDLPSRVLSSSLAPRAPPARA